MIILTRYTPMQGEYSNVWFDRREISIDALECRKSLSSMYETVNEMVVRESEGSGLPINRIVVGGCNSKFIFRLNYCNITSEQVLVWGAQFRYI